MTKTQTLITALTILMFSLLCLYKADAQTVTMTASVHYNNCNVQNATMPTNLTWYENEYGTYNFTAQVGNSVLFAIYSETTVMNFYLDEATWSINNGVYVAPDCKL